MALELSAAKALIFRITHRANLPWIIDNGLHSPNSRFDANYRNIGNPDLIQKSATRAVASQLGGTLNDYVRFYFTPFSIMLYNIRTGHGVAHVPNADIVIMVASLRDIAARGIPYAFTRKHAYLTGVEALTDLSGLEDQIDWPLLQSRDFRRDPEDPEKGERYQAEALIWKHLPLDALQGICCYTQEVEDEIKAMLD